MGADGKPHGTPLFARIGKSESDLRMAAVREGYVRFYGEVFVGLFVGVLVLHYVLFGPRRYQRRVPDELVQRFNVVERLAHLALLSSFGGAMATGMLNSIGIDFLFGVDIELMHALASLGLVGSAAFFFLLLARHMFSARFTRGQKAYFWFILVGVVCLTVCHLSMHYGVGGDRWETLAFTVYILCAQAMLIGVMIHVYLVTFANPGTLGSMFHGKVEREWLAHHHPDWKAEPAEKE
jgi:cytochrome b subunit of formate dehydrogenase